MAVLLLPGLSSRKFVVLVVRCSRCDGGQALK